MILSYNELVDIVNAGVIVGLKDTSQINAASIDVRLAGDFLMESGNTRGIGFKQVNLANRDKLTFDKHTIREGNSIFLDPGEFCLAATVELFNLPDDISAEFKLKSSVARSGLNQLTAVWCDAGWNGSALTLELSNVTRHHRLILEAGMPIGQMVFHRHSVVPHAQSYATRGRYNGDKTVSAIKA